MGSEGKVEDRYIRNRMQREDKGKDVKRGKESKGNGRERQGKWKGCKGN